LKKIILHAFLWRYFDGGGYGSVNSQLRSGPAAAPNIAASTRLLFIDNLRWTMIMLVITMHAAVTYSNLGRWYYNEKSHLDTGTFLFFASYQSWLQAFFMGLLFFIAGYFVPAKFDRKGAGRFLRDRTIRLGVPTLIYMFLIGPATTYYLLVLPRGARSSFPGWWVSYVTSSDIRNGGTGPLWFCLALLIFSTGYALVRFVAPGAPSSAKWTPKSRHVVTLIAAMAAATFLVRTVQPVGTALYNMQLCYFADYILFFIAGIHAGRHGWLTLLPWSFAMRWLAISVIGGGAAWFAVLLTATAVKAPAELYNGGVHWQSAVMTTWEAVFAVGVCLGLIVIFRHRFNAQGRLARFLSDNAFAVYVLHPPVVISASLALRNWHAPPIAKFAAVSAIATIVSFGVAFAVRTMPGVKRVL
jgi:glucans biosynthesis protein C